MKRILTLVLTAVTLIAACNRKPGVTYTAPPAGSYVAGIRQVKIGDAIVPVDGASVAPEFFKAAGVRPMLGRFFFDEDRKTGATTVVALSHALWKERFDSAPEIIGRQLEVDGHPATIVGIAPPGFTLPGATMVWTVK